MEIEQATRDSWQSKPMPASKTRLELALSFSPEEYERLCWGLIPQQMEDKWFVYLEDDGLYFHRSWTGIYIYQVRLEASGDGYRVAETWANRDPEQHKNTDDDYDVRLLHYLINRLLLGKDAPFPACGHIPQDLKDVYQHHVVGYSRAVPPSLARYA
jgi:hypothetical protein